MEAKADQNEVTEKGQVMVAEPDQVKVAETGQVKVAETDQVMMDKTDQVDEVQKKDESKIIELHELMEDAKELAAKWDDLGVELDFDYNKEIKQIRTDVNQVDMRAFYCFKGVIFKWFDGDAEKLKPQVLADAVEKCDHANLARDIRAKEAELKITPKEIIKLLKKMSYKYQMLALFLELPEGTVKELEKYAGDCRGCLHELLTRYLRKSPSVDQFCNAVAEIGYKNLSDRLRKKYEGKRFEQEKEESGDEEESIDGKKLL